MIREWRLRRLRAQEAYLSGRLEALKGILQPGAEVTSYYLDDYIATTSMLAEVRYKIGALENWK